MTQERGIVTFKVAGAGKFTGRGSAASFQRTIYYGTASEKLAALNELAVFYEWDVEENETVTLKGWEWK